MSIIRNPLIRGCKNLKEELSFVKWLGIKSTDLVLDVGSGQNPNLRANVLCDKYVIDNTERACEAPVFMDNRPFVIADGSILPFKDKSFDFVICSHVLEHVDEPGNFLEEIQRVGKGGYIETPHPIYEKMTGGWHVHKWFVSNDNGKLILQKKPKGILDSDLRYFFKLEGGDNLFRTFLVKNIKQLGLHTQYKWKHQINYIVNYQDIVLNDAGWGSADVRENEGQSASLLRKNISRLRKMKLALWKWIRRRSGRKCRSIISLIEILVCPICKAALEYDENDCQLICFHCKCQYPVFIAKTGCYILDFTKSYR